MKIKMGMKRIAAFLISLTIIAGATVFPVSASNGKSTIDFVLILDCSGSLEENDPNGLCVTASKMFLDMLPLENARVGIICFGYQGGNDLFTPNNTFFEFERQESSEVHVILPLTDVSKLNPDDVKSNIEGAISKGIIGSRNKTSHTPLGTAVLAGVEMLQSAGTVSNNACLLVITDGEIQSNFSVSDEYNRSLKAAELIGEKQWLLYTLHLNKDGKFDDKIADHQKVKDNLIEMAKRSGDSNRYVNLTTFESSTNNIGNTFVEIFDKLIEDQGKIKVDRFDSQGKYKQEITIDNLTSELTVVATGEGVDNIVLYDPLGNVISGHHDRVVITKEANRYYCVKLLCPTPGIWTAEVTGASDKALLFYSCSMKDMDATLKSSVSNDNANSLTKKDSVDFSVNFSYHGHSFTGTTDYFKRTNATLVVKDSNGLIVKTYPMEATDKGYWQSVSMRDLGAGSFSTIAEIEISNGNSVSNSINYSVINLPIQSKSGTVSSIRAHINQYIDHSIDMKSLFDNPDEDTIEVKTVVTHDGTESDSLNFVYDSEKGYLNLTNAGDKNGLFNIELFAKDPDSEFIKIGEFTVDVYNQAPIVSEIPEIILWSDRFPLQELFQKTEPESISVDLSRYVSDPDGLKIEYSVSNDDELYETSLNGSILEIKAIQNGEEGKRTISLIASDGIDAIEVPINVRIESGSKEFFKMATPRFILLLIAIVAIIIIIFLIVNNIYVKGRWTIIVEVEQNGKIARGKMLRTPLKNGDRNKRTKKFKLASYLSRYVPFMQIEEGDSQTLSCISSFISDLTFSRITMKGILLGEGCIFENCPDQPNGNCRADVNGGAAKKKFRFTKGQQVVFTITKPNGERAKITLSL